MHLKGQEHQTIIPSFHPSINPTLTLFQKELQAAAWQWLSSLNQTSVQAFLPFLLVPLVVTTETQGHESAKQKISKQKHFDWDQGTKMTRDTIMEIDILKKKSTICDSCHISTLKLFLKYTCCLLEGRMIVLKKLVCYPTHLLAN